MIIMSKKTRNIIIAVAVLLVLVIGALLIFKLNQPAAQKGDKTITVTVVHGDETRKVFTINTNAENLRGALEQEALIQGTESDWGLYVNTVDGETADDTIQQWWCFYDGNENMLNTGVDDTVISDGDAYEIILNTGW